MFFGPLHSVHYACILFYMYAVYYTRFQTKISALHYSNEASRVTVDTFLQQSHRLVALPKASIALELGVSTADEIHFCGSCMYLL